MANCRCRWPAPTSAEEVHEALLWMGYVTVAEAAPWQAWIDELAAAARIERSADGRWFAVEATRDPKEVLSGRMEALGPVFSDDPLMLQLQADGVVLRNRCGALFDRAVSIGRWLLGALDRRAMPGHL